MFRALYHMFMFSSQYGTTPLIWAARKGHSHSVVHLLANGADVDQEGAVNSFLVNSHFFTFLVLCTIFVLVKMLVKCLC